MNPQRTWIVIVAVVATAVFLGVGLIGHSGSTTSTASAAAAPAADAGSKAVQVAISKFQFMPATIAVAVGGTVTWKNADSFAHTVVDKAKAFKSGDLVGATTFSQTFTKAGTYSYYCGIHNSMVGTVTVT